MLPRALQIAPSVLRIGGANSCTLARGAPDSIGVPSRVLALGFSRSNGAVGGVGLAARRSEHELSCVAENDTEWLCVVVFALRYRTFLTNSTRAPPRSVTPNSVHSITPHMRLQIKGAHKNGVRFLRYLFFGLAGVCK